MDRATDGSIVGKRDIEGVFSTKRVTSVSIKSVFRDIIHRFVVMFGGSIIHPAFITFFIVVPYGFVSV